MTHHVKNCTNNEHGTFVHVPAAAEFTVNTSWRHSSSKRSKRDSLSFTEEEEDSPGQDECGTAFFHWCLNTKSCIINTSNYNNVSRRDFLWRVANRIWWWVPLHFSFMTCKFILAWYSNNYKSFKSFFFFQIMKYYYFMLISNVYIFLWLQGFLNAFLDYIVIACSFCHW